MLGFLYSFCCFTHPSCSALFVILLTFPYVYVLHLPLCCLFSGRVQVKNFRRAVALGMLTCTILNVLWWVIAQGIVTLATSASLFTDVLQISQLMQWWQLHMALSAYVGCVQGTAPLHSPLLPTSTWHWSKASRCLFLTLCGNTLNYYQRLPS